MVRVKRFKFVVFLIACFMTVCGRVDARGDFTVDDIINTVKERDMYKLLNTDGAIQIGKTGSGFEISTRNEGTDFVTEFSVHNGILSYDFPEGLEEAILVLQASMDATWIGEVSSAIAVLNGYSRDFLTNIDETVLTFDKNGIEYITQKYETFGLPYTVIQTVRIDLFNLRFDSDTDEPSTPGPDLPTEEKIPDIVLSNVVANSITINISNTEAGATCNIYRSKDDDSFALLASVPCSENYIDNNVEPNTLYAYRVDTGKNNMSSSKSVTTPNKSSSGNTGGNTGGNNGTVQNPNTGIVSHTLVIVGLGILGVLSLNFLRKKDLFKKL